MAVATIRQIYIVPVVNSTPQWMPFTVPDDRYPGLTAGVGFMNDAPVGDEFYDKFLVKDHWYQIVTTPVGYFGAGVVAGDIIRPESDNVWADETTRVQEIVGWDGSQSTLQPVPFTSTCMVVLFTSVANAAILAAYATTDWAYFEDLPEPEVP